jgi:hypothetical protein
MRRSELSHDCIQNSFIGVIRGVEGNLMAERLADPFNLEAVKEIAKRWALWSNFAEDLFTSAIHELSPQKTFSFWPLSNCPPDTKYWLIPVVVEFWKIRTKIEHKLSEAQQKKDSLNAVVDEIDRFLATTKELNAENVGSYSVLVENLKQAAIEFQMSLARLSVRYIAL